MHFRMKTIENILETIVCSINKTKQEESLQVIVIFDILHRILIYFLNAHLFVKMKLFIRKLYQLLIVDFDAEHIENFGHCVQFILFLIEPLEFISF